MSSLKDLASLIMVPSLYKDGELHTVKPLADENIIVHPDATDNNDGFDGSTPSTSSNFTFSRGSNLAATRVDVNGLIEKGRENLLLQSNQFDTTWQLTTNTTITGGQSGYDGTNDAWLLTKDDNQYRAVYQDVSVTGVWTLSVYAKANTLDIITLRDSDSQGRVEFDLSDGSVRNIRTENIVAYDISSVGNDWYRCQVSFSGATSRIQFYADFNDPTEAGSIYIQDAQLEQGLVATDYIETGASTAQAGILEDMPRLDYSGSCPSLLLEPQRTNQLENSEYFGSWNNGSYPVTITSNSATSPDGTTNATLITPASGSNRHAIRDLNVVSVAGTTYTLSAFFKKAGSRYVVLGDSGDSAWHLVTADLDNGTITDETSATGTIEPYENDWYRITCTFTRTNANTIQTFLGASPTDTETSAPVFDDISLTTYVYGAQVEASASYPTSYIPTYGTSQTRSNDAVSITGIQTNGLIGSNKGSFVFHYKPYNAYTGGGGKIYDFRIDSNNRMATYFSNGTLRLFSNIAGATNFNQGTTLDGDTEFKIGVAYDADSTLVYINGTLTYTLNGFDLGVTDFDILPPTNGSKVADFSWFPTKLTATELASLTTL